MDRKTMQSDIIERAALGRQANFGCLYDARTDNFCEMSVLSEPIPVSEVSSEDVNKAEAHLMYSDPLSKMFFVEKELRVSLFTKLCEIEGSWKALVNRRSVINTVTNYILYQIKKRYEYIEFPQHFDAIKMDTMQDKGTHVVVGIYWGANSILSCTYKNPDKIDPRQFEAPTERLKLIIENAAVAAVNFDGTYPRLLKIFGDILPTEMTDSLTMEQALETMKGLPSRVNSCNNGKGMPIIYHLLPISSLMSYLNLHITRNISFRTLKESALNRIIVSLDRRVEAIGELVELNKEVETHKCCVKKKHIVKISELNKEKTNEMESFLIHLRSSLQKVRLGTADASVIKDFIKIESNLTACDNIKAMLANFNDVRSKIRFADKVLKCGAKYVGYGTALQEAIQFDQDIQSYVLLFTQKSMVKGLSTWNGNCQLFFQQMENNDNTSKYYAVDCDFHSNLLQEHESSCIKVFQGGRIIVNDLLQEKGKSAMVDKLNSTAEELNADQKEPVVPNVNPISTDISEPVSIPNKERVTMMTSIRPDPEAADPSPCTYIGPCYQEDTLDTDTLATTSQIVPNERKTHVRPKSPAPPVPQSFDASYGCTVSNSRHDEQEQVLAPAPESMRISKDHLSDSEDNVSEAKAVSAEEEQITEPINLQSSKELNILILGETGVGKSTWINGFINYTRFHSLEEAEQGELNVIIPSSFTVYDENIKQITVSTGSDENEVMQPGQSATQQARVYPVPFEDSLIRLIDTPGIGDTRGIEQDKVNFQNILTTLSYLEEIHGICIFLKPNNARLNVMFRFCIKELLKYLHRDASKNIIFCFTNSRGTLYRPGDTYPALMTLLNENKEVEIPVNKKTVYCFDSEAYRFLAAVKNNPPITFSKEERDNFSRSWDKSVAETNRMIGYIKELAPHPIQSTLNLNYVRELVLKMVRPLAEITRNVQTNQSILEQERAEIENTRENIKELEKRRMTKRTEVKVSPLSHPRMVCSHIKCMRVWSVGDVKTTQYATICHDKCRLFFVKQDSIGSPLLRLCSKLRSGNCKHADCEHNYKEHLRIYYESKQEVTQEENRAVTESIEKNMSAKEMKQNMINEKDGLISQYQSELKEIENASVTFAYFLKINAITAYSDEMELYFHHLIREETYKVNAGGSERTLRLLERSLQSYRNEKDLLEQQVKKKEKTAPTTESVNELVRKLKKLKFSGESLTEALNCVNHAGKLEYRESIERRPPTSGAARKERELESDEVTYL